MTVGVTNGVAIVTLTVLTLLIGRAGTYQVARDAISNGGTCCKEQKYRQGYLVGIQKGNLGPYSQSIRTTYGSVSYCLRHIGTTVYGTVGTTDAL